MNDLGLTLAWLAVQVSLVLAPALMLYALASRRSPAAGAWVAALSLGFVVVLNASAFLPGIGRGGRSASDHDAEVPRPAPAASPPGTPAGIVGEAPGRSTTGSSPFASLRIAWDRLERGAAKPAALCRPLVRVMAPLVLAGIAAGLLRLAFGLGAVVACRRRGKPVDDPAMIGLLDELRGAIGCRRPIELCEVPDLVGPATAGWRRPVILLPADWWSWDESERRAVLAHELAHVVRGDYAAGLLARLAVALNVYHPMVHWMAAQLRLQQELAADAMGAWHAGGRVGYLVALSRLALSQDGRSPCWPARAFLPARGTLIRRIAMLRDETRSEMGDRPWSRARRMSATVLLLGVTAALVALRGPARGSEDGAPAAGKVPSGAPAVRPAYALALPLYLREGTSGVVVFRPSLASRHAGANQLASYVLRDMADVFKISKAAGDNTARPGSLKLGIEDLESITACLSFGKTKGKDQPEMHTLMLAPQTFRTVKPFDWLALLRQWGFEFTEVRELGYVYYRIGGPLKSDLGPRDHAAYLPDDRTIVVDEESMIRKLARQETPPPPAFVRSPEWERACRGLLAVAINNQDGAFAKDYDLSRPDDAVVLSLFKGVDHWTFSVDDAEAVVLRAWAGCGNGEASRVIAPIIEALVKQGRDALDREVKSPGPPDRITDMSRALLTHLRVEHTDRSIGIRSEGFATIAEFASMLGTEIQYEKGAEAERKASKKSKP